MGSDRALAVSCYDGAGPRFLGVINAKYGTPVRVNVFSGIVATLIVILAENQRGNADELVRSGAAVCVEEAALQRTDGLAALIGTLGRDPDRLARMSAAATGIVDGAGAIRVREACVRLVESAIRH